MKIMICGSMTFAKEIIKTKEKLEKFGHEVNVPLDIKSHVADPNLIDDLEVNYRHAQETNIMKACFNLIAKSDAILVLNHVKNGIKGYVGTSSLMEIGLAYYLNKKIFLLNPFPKSSEARWAQEVRIMQSIVIHGDLTQIK